MEHPHFKGKKALEHVIEARQKGRSASEEIHGAELPGHFFAGFDAAKEAAVLLLLLGILLHFYLPHPMKFLTIFSFSFLLWKFGRSSLLGWIRLERLHRLIAEERWEIEHHRPQERKELIAFYEAKGFSGKLLEEVIDVLMSDDNRLLQVMLEEELGLTLGFFEHPLKQGVGAAVGVCIASTLAATGYFFHPIYGSLLMIAITIGISGGLAAKMEKNKVVNAVTWNLSICALAAFVCYFLCHLLT